MLFVFFFLVAFVAFRTLGIWSCVAFCSLAYVSFVFSVSWLVAFVALGNSSTIVKTKSKTSIRTKKGAIISKIRERSNDRLYRNTWLTSNETIRAQHSLPQPIFYMFTRCMLLIFIHTAYQIQPRTLHMRMGIIIVLSAGGGAPSPPIPFRFFIQIQTCTLLNTLLYMRV